LHFVELIIASSNLLNFALLSLWLLSFHYYGQMELQLDYLVLNGGSPLNYCFSSLFLYTLLVLAYFFFETLE